MSLGEKGRARDHVSSRILTGSRCHLGWVTSGLGKQLKAVKDWALGLGEAVTTTQGGSEKERAKKSRRAQIEKQVGGHTLLLTSTLPSI